MLVPLFAGPGHRAHRMVQTQDGEAAAASTGVLGAGRRPAPSRRHCSTLDAHKTRDVCMLENGPPRCKRLAPRESRAVRDPQREAGVSTPCAAPPHPQFQQQSFGTGLVFKGRKKTVNIPLGECAEPLAARLPTRCVRTEEQCLQL